MLLAHTIAFLGIGLGDRALDAVELAELLDSDIGASGVAGMSYMRLGTLAGSGPESIFELLSASTISVAST